jgi:ligand-binding sensor domain-containing protein
VKGFPSAAGQIHPPDFFGKFTRRLLRLATAWAFVGVLRAANPLPPESNFLWAVYGANAGLPQPIEAVAQTQDGYLWLGTQAGVVRFDGVRFTVYRAADNPGLPFNAVQSLLGDSTGALWIGTDRGLARYRAGRFETIGLSEASITALREDRQGVIWIGTRQGLWQYREGALQLVNDKLFPRGNPIREIFADRLGRIWVASFREPVVCYEGGGYRLFEHAGAPLRGVESIAEMRDGTLWFSTVDNGLFRLRGDELSNFGPEQGLGSRITGAVFVDHRDNVWAVANGVFLLGRGGPERFGLAFPRTFENFRAIAEDREGNLWLATHANGLIRLTPTALRMFPEDSVLRSSIRSVAEDRQGNLWVAVTQGPLISLAPNGAVTAFEPRTAYAEDPYSEYVTADGSLWNAGRRLLQVIRDGRVENYPQYPSVRAIYQDHTGAVWLAPETGPVVRYQEGRFETIGGRNGVPVANAVCFAEDAAGTFYIGLHRAGLVTLKNGVAQVQNTDTGLPANDLRAVYADAEGNLWLGLKGRGLAVFTDGRWWNPQAFTDLFQDQVSALIEDGRGNLFIGSLKGVSYASKAALLAMARGGPPAPLHTVVLGDGVLSDAVYSSTQPVVWKAHDGILWFATRQGLYGIDPAKLAVNTTPPPVYVERIVADNQPQAAEGNVRLAPGTRVLAIDYTALGFRRPQEVLFKYRLEGYDDRWVEAGTRRTAFYSNLAPRSYRFHVIACNDDGVWNETGATFAFELQPYFYQTKWFYAVCLAAVVVAIAGGFRWQAARLKTRQRELQQRVDEAMAKVKVLSGLLPICSSCKKVRDDKGYWNQIEVYIRDRSNAEFSHSFCPDCLQKLFPSFDDE